MNAQAPANMVMVTIKEWIRQEKGLPSRNLAGVIVSQTAKAIQFRGRIAVRTSTHCLRCNRPLTDPVSQAIGYGPDCCAEMGLPRPNVAEMTEAQVADLKKGLKQITVDTWLPKTQIISVIDVQGNAVALTGGTATAPAQAPTQAPRRESFRQVMARVHQTPPPPERTNWDHIQVEGEPYYNPDTMETRPSRFF